MMLAVGSKSAHESSKHIPIPTDVEESYLYDKIAYKLMTDAVTLYPCGHSVSEESVPLLKGLCPFDRQEFTGTCPNYIIRNLALDMEKAIENQSSIQNSLICNYADEDITLEMRKALFWTAAEKGSEDQVKHHLQRGLDVNVVNEQGWTALLFSASRGHLLVVKILLGRAANPNASDQFKMTALMWSAKGKHPEIVTALLDGGAFIDAVDFEGRTALMFAARAGCFESVQILTERGAKVNIKSNKGDTAMSFAETKQYGNIVMHLQEKGAKSNSWI